MTGLVVPMKKTVLLAALVLVLSGCSAPAEDPVVEDDVNVVTDPDDYSYVEKDGAGWHVHDYWQGQDEVVVVDAQGGTLRASCQGCENGMGIGSFRPAPEHIVPQGTAWVNVTVTLDVQDGDYNHLELWAKPADADESRSFGEIPGNGTVAIPSTNDMNDPPHHVLSLWRFEIRVMGGETVSFEGSVGLQAVAVRGLEIPPYPPHPDHWEGGTEIDLFSVEGSSLLQYETETSYSCYNGCLGWHAPDDGVIVPHDTAEVVVRLTYGPGLPHVLGLRYHGADTWDMRDVPGEITGPTEVTFRIPIEETRGDSPYAKQSLWEFRVFNAQPSDVRAWSGSYTLEATAIKAG